jgi:hypothetical protein
MVRWTTVGAMALVAAVGAVAAPDDLTELEWLSGCWRSEREGRTSEECWTAPAGDMLLGVHRDVGPRGASFEFLRIGRDGDAIAYFASPSGRPAVVFRLVKTGKDRAVFENPDHDFPQRLVYWREGDRLHAVAETIAEGGTRLEFAWDRVASEWKR